MKNIFKILGVCSLGVLSLTSCERDVSTLNVDPKKPSAVPSENLISTVSYYLSDQYVSPSVNTNITRFFTQQWTETTYTSETNYQFSDRNQNQALFNTMFREVIGPLSKAKGYVDNEIESVAYSSADQAKIKANKKAVIEIISVFGWATLVDSFGDIPYTESLKNDAAGELVLQPKYDDAATIYNDLATRLDAALATISVGVPGYEKDPYYAGDMAQWKKVANTLKLQMGLNLADVNNAKAKTLIESAVAGGVIVSADDNWEFHFDSSQFSNPIYQNLVASGRNDFLPSDVFVNAMKAKNDPRIPQYFTEAPDGTYKGGVYGLLNTYGNYSKVADRIKVATAPGKIFDNVNVEFMLAEAAARGFNVGGTAATFYATAITASMSDWDVSAADIAAYVAAHPYDATNWKKSIGEEAWVAMYNRGFEAWNFWRRLDFPKLNPAPTADHGYVYRMPYPLGENNNNTTNVKEAAAKIPGGDLYSSKVFWDKF